MRMNPMMMKATGKLFIFWNTHGATISVVTGCVGLIGAGIFGAIQWAKCKRLIDECNEDLDKIDETVGKELIINGEPHVYTEEDAQKDRSITKRKMIGGCLRKLSGPFAMACGSSVGVAYGIKDFKKKIAAYALYAGGLEQTLAQHDKIFRKEFGDEKVDMLYQGLRQETTEKVEVDEETGVNKVTLEDQIRREFDITPDNVLTYKYGYGCSDWTPGDRNANLQQLKLSQRVLNETKDIRGFVTGNDVLECVGIPFKTATPATSILASIWDKTKIKEENKVIFKIVEDGSDEITFTVPFDGIIMDKIKKVNKDGCRKLKRYQ